MLQDEGRNVYIPSFGMSKAIHEWWVGFTWYIIPFASAAFALQISVSYMMMILMRRFWHYLLELDSPFPCPFSVYVLTPSPSKNE